MKECTNCGQTLNDESIFCTNCGASSQEKTQASQSQQANNSSPQPIASPNPVWQNPYPYNNTRLLKKENPMKVALNILYSLVLFFILIPMPFSSNFFDGYGDYGYGTRQQIGKFMSLINDTSDKTTQILISSAWILLIAAVIVSICFCIVGMIYLNSAKKLNIKLLKVFNIFIAGSMGFIFLLTIPYLTFTFMCALTAIFYIVLITFKERFAKDFVKRSGNETANTAAVMMVMISIILLLCFSPIYNFETSIMGFSHIVNSHNFYSITLNKQDPAFLSIISAITLILILIAYIYLFIQYLRQKKVLGGIPVILIAACLIASVLIGANILVEIKLGNQLNYNIRANYYILITSMLVFIIVFFIQLATTGKNSKKIDTIKEE